MDMRVSSVHIAGRFLPEFRGGPRGWGDIAGRFLLEFRGAPRGYL